MNHPRAESLAGTVGLVCLLLASTLFPRSAGAQETGDPEWWSVLDSVPEGVHLMVVDSLYGFNAWDEQTIGVQLTLGGHEIEGETFRGLHRASYRYRYTTEREGTQCRVREFTVVIRSVIRMPVLLNVDELDEELAELWSSYESNLRTHEEGHRDITRQTLVEFRDAARAAPFGPCEPLRDRILALRDSHSELMQSRQVLYDDETGHGRTQGADWPPRGGR